MANNLPKKNLYIELAYRLWCNARCIPLWCQLSGKDDLSVSAYMDIDFPLMTTEAKCHHFPISSFPISHFSFLISHFLVPTFRVTRKAWEKESRVWRQVVKVDARGAVTDRCNSQTLRWSASSLPHNELYWHCLLNATVSSFWTKYYKKNFKILHQAPPPSRLPSRLSDVTHVTLSPRPPPSVFTYSIRSKTGGWNGLETRLDCSRNWERGVVLRHPSLGMRVVISAW